MGDCNHPIICRKNNTAGHKHPGGFISDRGANKKCSSGRPIYINIAKYCDGLLIFTFLCSPADTLSQKFVFHEQHLTPAQYLQNVVMDINSKISQIQKIFSVINKLKAIFTMEKKHYCSNSYCIFKDRHFFFYSYQT